MKFLFLGSGGATTIPKPGCGCRVCGEARQKGLPYSRLGPCLFLPEHNLLLDTPEGLYIALERHSIRKIGGLIYSHFHRDHLNGIGAIEELLVDHLRLEHRRIPLYATPSLLKTLRENLTLLSFYLDGLGILRWARMTDLEPTVVDGLAITPVPLSQPGFYGYILADEARRALVVPDHFNLFDPGCVKPGLDLAILEMGYIPPLRDGFVPPPGHRVFRRLMSLERCISIARDTLRAERVIFTHIEEIFGRSFDELADLGSELGVEFAHDGMEI